MIKIKDRSLFDGEIVTTQIKYWTKLQQQKPKQTCHHTYFEVTIWPETGDFFLT